MIELDNRKQLILAAIVEEFIETGEPVGSRAVSNKLSISVSSATIRNEMSALSEMGLIEQPHTSAGRVPSHLGYKFYIDRLMDRKPLSKHDQQMIDTALSEAKSDYELFLETASNSLAFVTKCASITTSLKSNVSVYCKIELIPIGYRLFVLLIIGSTGEVRNKTCSVDMDISENDRHSFVNIVNAELIITPIEKITPAFIQTVSAKVGKNALYMTNILTAIYSISSDMAEGHLFLEGQTNLFEHRELAQNAKDVMEFLSKQDLLKKIASDNPYSLSVMIGTEGDSLLIPDVGLIIAKYNVGSKSVGSIGIIGPSRLDYAKMIPYIEYFANSMGKILTDIFEEY